MAEEETTSTSESTSTEDTMDLATLIEALQIFKKYGNKEYPIQCEANIMYILIDPSIVSKKDKLKLQGRGFLPYSDGPAFYSVYYGSAKGYSGQ
jgi:ribonuclease HI